VGRGVAGVAGGAPGIWRAMLSARARWRAMLSARARARAAAAASGVGWTGAAAGSRRTALSARVGSLPSES
jgi:hypothetical protein